MTVQHVSPHSLPHTHTHTKERTVNLQGPLLLYIARAVPAAAEGKASAFQNIYLLNCRCYTYVLAHQRNNFQGPFLGKEVLTQEGRASADVQVQLVST